jgi:membrane fusion protein (multidrug efflux system)
MRLFVLLVLIAAVAAGGYYWYAHVRVAGETAAADAGAAGGFAIPIEAAKVVAEPLTLSIPTVGSLRSNESVTLSPEIAGRIAELHLEEGGSVAAGATIAVLDQSVDKAELAQAQAALELSRANFKRAEELLAKNAGTARARDEAVAALRNDEASVALARARLEKTVLTAPFDGVLGLRQVSVGQYMDPGDPIVNLEDIDPLKVDFRVPEIYYAVVEVGQAIEILLDAFPDDSFIGTVYAIDPQIDVNGRAIVIRANVPNADRKLRPGLFARVNLIYESRDNVLFVPEQALVPQGDAQSVFRVIDGKAVLTPVKIGTRVGATVEIQEGLAEGELVVTAGQIKLQDGVPVMVPEAAPAAPAQGAPDPAAAPAAGG